MRHTDILTQVLVRHIMPLFIRDAIAGIWDERHFCHLLDRYGREVVINLNGSQQQVTPSAQKGVLFQAVAEMGSIEKSPFYIDPCPEVHIAFFVGTCLRETR